MWRALLVGGPLPGSRGKCHGMLRDRDSDDSDRFRVGSQEAAAHPYPHRRTRRSHHLLHPTREVRRLLGPGAALPAALVRLGGGGGVAGASQPGAGMAR